MHPLPSFPLTKLTLVMSLLVSHSPAFAQEPGLPPAGSDVEEIYIVGVRDNRVSKGATGLSLDIKETPQSISVVGRDLMDAFSTTNLNDALKLATGISVEEWETNRTNYTARGFDIKNTQVDGVGMPNNWGIVTGVMDSAGYEKLEVIRGANGLLTGVGNASGTINYVRKRPGNAAQGSATFSAGSFNSRRAEIDYSSPFTDDAEWAGRVVAVREVGESYIEGLENDHSYIYGVVDGQLTENSTLTAGYSYQDADTVGNFWGGLVLSNSDKTQAEFDRSVSTSQDWTYWDTNNTNAFVEYTYQLSPDWETKFTYNFRNTENDDQLFYVLTENGIDKATGLGLNGWPGKYQDEEDAHLLDGSITGRFELFGLTQEVIFGLSTAKSDFLMHSYATDPEEPASGALPPFPFRGDAIPEPVWGERYVYEDSNQKLDRAYGALRLSATKDLTAVLGFNYARYRRDVYDSENDQSEQKFSPYAGITYDFSHHILGYVSYSDIYQPQDYTDFYGDYLDPSKGVNYEIGVKADWLDKRLLTTLAWFTAEQKNLGTHVGFNDAGRYVYAGRDINSEGVELEITGQIGSLTSVVFGLTELTLEDQQGADTYEWVPRETINIAFSTKLPHHTDIAFGASAKWQSGIKQFDEVVGMTLRQESYATLNLFASWDLSERTQLKLNLNNVTDEKYLTSLYNVGFYAAPRTVEGSLKIDF